MKKIHEGITIIKLTILQNEVDPEVFQTTISTMKNLTVKQYEDIIKTQNIMIRLKEILEEDQDE